MSEDSSLNFDVVIVGAGVSGLSAAIKIKQESPETSVVVLEKGSEVGAHILSGAVIEPTALNELIPDWKEKNSPLTVEAQSDEFLLLSKKSAITLPTPPQMKNEGNYIVSLGNFCRWLSEQAMALGVDIFPGFAASEVLFDDNDRVIGVKTGDMGVRKDGSRKDSYQEGVNVLGKITLFGEGCRGSLTEELFDKFNLRKDCDPQTYALGIKELWEVDNDYHKQGNVTHTVGWPLDNETYGGSFMYHLSDNLISIGFVVALDYQNPYLSPYEEFQRFKTHPHIKKYLQNGKRISYGARALNEGGLQSIPNLTFAGGAIIGCAAGFLNVAKIKGTHTAMKSGMIAANSVIDSLKNDNDNIKSYENDLKKSWIYKELKAVRNIRPAFKYGLYSGIALSALSTLLKGYEPWTFRHKADHKSLKLAKNSKKIDYPKPDNIFSFDKLSSVQLSNTNHGEDQKVHLTLKDQQTPTAINLARYDGPEARYCPAGVYEYIQENGVNRLKINSQNCVHCKTCDIKDPTQNIKWICPEGGDGPRYPNM